MAPTADVWIVSLPVTESVDPEAWKSLSPDERDRADRLRQPVDRARYVSAHAALRTVLASRLRCSVASLLFARTSAGKPHVEGSALRFNLSRSEDRAAIGVCETSEIGVDTEAVRSGNDHMAIAGREFSSAEQAWMTSGSELERLYRFYRLWVVREALGKAAGVGLAIPSSSIEVEIVDGAPQPRARLAWEAHEAPPDPAYVTAAVLAPGAAVRWHMTSWDAPVGL